MKQVPKMVEKVMDKVPDFDSFKKDGSKGQWYFFLIIFTVYFLYKEVYQSNDCDKRVAVLEMTIAEYKEQKEEDRKRIISLERAFDIKSGILNVVNEKADSVTEQVSEGGTQ